MTHTYTHTYLDIFVFDEFLRIVIIASLFEARHGTSTSDGTQLDGTHMPTFGIVMHTYTHTERGKKTATYSNCVSISLMYMCTTMPMSLFGLFFFIEPHVFLPCLCACACVCTCIYTSIILSAIPL